MVEGCCLKPIIEYEDIRHVNPLLQKYVDRYPEFDKSDIIDDLVTGATLGFYGDKFLVIVRVNDYGNKQRLLVEHLVGSDHQEWLHEVEDIEAIAKQMGLDEVEFYGRLGWKNIMSEYGYKVEQVVMRKQI